MFTAKTEGAVKLEQVLDDGLAPPDRIIGITAEISTPVYTLHKMAQLTLQYTHYTEWHS